VKNLLGQSLNSRVSSDAKCKILAVSPMVDRHREKVLFCEIMEGGRIDYQALSETKVREYYSDGNNQDLRSLYDSDSKQTIIIRQTRREWLAEGRRRFGNNISDWKFKCPQCGRINLVREFERYNIGGRTALNHCIDYFFHHEGCNWKANGVFSPNGQLQIMTRENGREIEVFEFADVEVEVE